MIAEIILAAIVAAGLVYVHLRPTEELKKFCLWGPGVAVFNFLVRLGKGIYDLIQKKRNKEPAEIITETASNPPIRVKDNKPNEKDIP